jgi:hypothetical protein
LRTVQTMRAEELEHAVFIPRFSRPQMLMLLGIVSTRTLPIIRTRTLLFFSVIVQWGTT